MKHSALERLANSFGLFASLSTLLCCALPALFVALGAGAVVVSLVSAVPQLVWLSKHKVGLFLFTGLLLAAASLYRYLNRHAPCPADPALAAVCTRRRKLDALLHRFSVVVFLIGCFFAFIAPHLMG